MGQEDAVALEAPEKTVRRRNFRGLSLEQRKRERRERLIKAGLQVYGTHGFFAVTVRDVCAEAKLTERYFYESFKNSEQLFKVIYLQLMEQQQQTVMTAVMHAAGRSHDEMVRAGLIVFLRSLQDDPRIARILFVDAVLVSELHGTTIIEAVSRFDRMIQGLMLLMLPDAHRHGVHMSLVSTGLNGYVTHIVIRWVMGGFKEPFDEVLSACQVVYDAFLNLMAQQHSAAAPKTVPTPH
ncbi:MAG: TetR/AcrR family transcriptional regulator [Pseudomonadota bacterium]|nr:TetR/AcrR family transcriptional regulator [Pseudomonadota bacterium]